MASQPQSLAAARKERQWSDSNIRGHDLRDEHKRRQPQQKSVANPRVMDLEPKTIVGEKRMAQFTRLFTFSG
jgi:hypothetical protein